MQKSLLHRIYADATRLLSGSSHPIKAAKETNNLEVHLISFIEWSLRQSRSPQLTAYARMKILERAWEAQKKVWAIRSAESSLSIQWADSN